MEPVAIPKTIDDPIHILLWSADEIVPFMVCMLTGILIDQFIPALAIGVISVKFYRRFRDNRPDGYTLHAVYWLGLLPSNGRPLTPCYPARARELVRKQRAVRVCRHPYTIRLLDPSRHEAATRPYILILIPQKTRISD